MSDDQSFFESHRTVGRLVRDAERFAVRLPIVGQLGIPRPDQLAYCAGLAALVALDLIEWPVAVAIAVGTAVASEQHGRRPGEDSAKPEKSSPNPSSEAPPVPHR
ncbi:MULTISPECIES: hypothetical protein [Rhodococcus]|uniref:Uncharacterized protein n=1 Tax=Rhodococcus opacus RKJ300 = JCM 13270 TaxID=1165867 RepID=I0WWW1_RHOOP|nr:MULTISPECIES: hypothetical protein [Rhodococcus]EID80877.1 hypothetical protein W59_05898 [Rhodococcus opacus RKJ300 = JCM 13270]QQZ14448.1 hypothetical protein GO592_33290 [Rhodococcus sp. 21391]